MPGRIETTSQPGNDDPGQSDDRKSRRLVLCFDGTNNQFTGGPSDTNIVKIYEMLDRTVDDQFHYYQPGIGTYSSNPLSSSINPMVKIRESFDSAIDQGFASSFVSHVMAGYSFLMKHYAPGDKIYIFGFSRGAYTARFLSEMIYWLGLLSRSNEEMIRFAWKTFQEFQQHRDDESFDKAIQEAMKRRKDPAFDPLAHVVENEPKQLTKVMRFREVFCRSEVPIYFLGLFDCVNSVAQFQIPFSKRASPYIPFPPAQHIRHAVSLTERRIKFRPALFRLEDYEDTLNEIKEDENRTLEEVWFGGNHADCGGGWDPLPKTGLLLSDLPLEWMVSELVHIENREKETLGAEEANVLAWRPILLTNLQTRASNLTSAIELHDKRNSDGTPSTSHELQKLFHDPLRFWTGTGSGLGMLFFWWLFEINLSGRYELRDKKWVPTVWPPNYGSNRDAPTKFKVHHSVPTMIHAELLPWARMPYLGGDQQINPFTRFWRWISGHKTTAPDTKDLSVFPKRKSNLTST